MGKKELHYKVLVITCIFWLIAKGISWQVWLLERPIPIMPPFEMLHAVPAWIHLTLFAVSVSTMALLSWKPIRPLLFLLVVSELLSCLLDQTRWQPWQYQYLFMTFIFWVNCKRPQQILSMVVFIFCSTYFYSGLAKLNTNFLEGMWQDTILTRFLHLPAFIAKNHFVKLAGILLPTTEFICGLGLLFSKTRKTAATILIAMHVFILCLIGPLGINYNIIVWPWNVAMIILLNLLFLKHKPSFKFFSTINWRNTIVYILWGILPALSFVGHWDHYLSSNLYSGQAKNLLIAIDNCEDDVPNSLSKYLIKDKYKISACGEVLSVNKWYMKQMNVPCYPEERIFKKLKILFLKKYPEEDLHFFVKGKKVEAF